MRTLLRVLTALAGLFFLVLGLLFLAAPQRVSASFALYPFGSAGYNTIAAWIQTGCVP